MPLTTEYNRHKRAACPYGRIVVPLPITFSCNCGKNVQVGDEFAGQEGRCPSCGQMVHIPGIDGRFTSRPPSSTAIREPPIPRPETLPEPDEDDLLPLKTHAGKPILADDDFFHEAPLKIGRVYSAFTTLKSHVHPKSIGLRLSIAGIVFTLCMAVIFIATLTIQINLARLPVLDVVFPLALSVFAGALSAGIAYWWTEFRQYCSYVGTKGVAQFHCHGDRDAISDAAVFLFAEAVELRIGQTRHYYNGLYTGTQYSFEWKDDRGHVVYQLTGKYKSEEGTPGPKDHYHFALMAENAWTMHLLRDMERVESSNKRLFFGLKGGDYVELGQGVFVLMQLGKTTTLRAEQIEKMTIGNGVVSIWEVGAQAGWFVNKGVHQFMYQDLGNARFFLIAAEKLLGIRF